MYWGSDGEQHTWNIKEHMGLRLSLFGEIDFGRDYYFLIPGEGEPGIDFSKEIKIQRKGKLPNCIDEINFEDATLLKDETGMVSRIFTVVVKTIWWSDG